MGKFQPQQFLGLPWYVWLIIGIVCLVIFVGVGLVVYFLIYRKDKTSESILVEDHGIYESVKPSPWNFLDVVKGEQQMYDFHHSLRMKDNDDDHLKMINKLDEENQKAFIGFLSKRRSYLPHLHPSFGDLVEKYSDGGKRRRRRRRTTSRRPSHRKRGRK